MSLKLYEDDDTMSEEISPPSDRRMTRVLSKSEIDESFDGDKTILQEQDSEPDYEERLRGMTSEQVEELLHKLNLEENNHKGNEDGSETEDEISNEPEKHVEKNISKPNKKKEKQIQAKKGDKLNKKGLTIGGSDSKNKNDNITAPPASPIKEEVKPKKAKNKKDDIKSKAIHEDKPTPMNSEDEIKVKKVKKDVSNIPLISGDKKLEEIEDVTKNRKTKKGTKEKQINSENKKDELHQQENKSKNNLKLKETTDTDINQDPDSNQQNKSKAVSKAGKKMHSEVLDNKEAKSKLGKSSKNTPNVIEKETSETIVKTSTDDVEEGEHKVKKGKPTKKANNINTGKSKSEENLAKTKKASSKEGGDKDHEKLDKGNPTKKNQKVLKEVNDLIDKPVESEQTTTGRPKRNIKKDNSSGQLAENVDNSKAQKPKIKLDDEKEKKPELTKSKPKTKIESSKEKLTNKENNMLNEGEMTKRVTRKK